MALGKKELVALLSGGKYLKESGGVLAGDIPAGGGGGVSSFNGRTGAVSPAQADYDTFFLTQTEGDARYSLTGHTHAPSDPWTYVTVNGGSDFTTTSGTAVDVTGLAFTPAANTTYEFEAQLMLRTATATVNPRAGLAWATGLTDGIGNIDQSQTATTILMARGNISAALLIAVGGLPNTTQSWPATIWGFVRAGASPSGTVRVQLASETAGTVVRVVANSFLKYRSI